MAMPAHAVVEDLDIVEVIRAGDLPGLVDSLLHALLLDTTLIAATPFSLLLRYRRCPSSSGPAFWSGGFGAEIGGLRPQRAGRQKNFAFYSGSCVGLTPFGLGMVIR